ncbi:DoxX family membrane protein [Albidovulum sp.]
MIALHDRFAGALAALAPTLLPTLARLVFAGVLLSYFWTSALTKIGPGIGGLLSPTDGAYIQIFPRAMEAAGYDSSQLTSYHWAVVVAGTWAELLLPLCLVLGLFARLAALGMIGFVIVQSLTDIYGHGVGGADLGRWFDADSGALIADQRALWIVLLAGIAMLGAGPLSLDRVLTRNRR